MQTFFWQSAFALNYATSIEWLVDVVLPAKQMNPNLHQFWLRVVFTYLLI